MRQRISSGWIRSRALTYRVKVSSVEEESVFCPVFVSALALAEMP